MPPKPPVKPTIPPKPVPTKPPAKPVAKSKPVAKKPPVKPAVKPVAPKPKLVQAKKPGLFSNINEKLALLTTIPLAEKLFFINHLRVLVHAGLSISDSMGTLAEQTENKRFSKILKEIKVGIEKGEKLSTNLAKHPRVFPRIFVSMIEAGEMSGTLEKNLEQLALQMKKEHNLRSKIKGALTYPVVILVATAGIVTAMIVYIIPRMISIFEEMEAELPLATKILITVNKFILEHSIIVVIGLVVIIILFIVAIRRPTGKHILHKFFLTTPILGPVARKVNLARFARTLSSLLKTDIPVVKSFETTADILGNVHYKKIVVEAAEKLKKGVLIAESLSKNKKLFPPLVIQMISIGEKSGNLDVLLEDLAVFYEEQVDDTVKSLSSIIEPLLILFLGLIVGGIAVAIISPIYSLSQQV
ncbi:MAG: type II secretion system F family protein [Patescibacteria group bacterium]|nr:type II secretion system F family protein [Patescibacteria group bacterium]